MDKNGENSYTETLLVNDRPIKFIIETGSPVTLIPMAKFNNTTKTKPMTEKYKDVNDNNINFTGKTAAEIDFKEKNLELLLTKRNTNPLLGLDLMKQLGMELRKPETKETVNNMKEDDDEKEIKSKFVKLFNINHTIKNMEKDNELKPGAKLMQQKTRPIPIHLQNNVEKETKRLIESGHLKKATEADENCFVSPAVIPVKRDKPIKFALKSRKLNGINIKKKAQMPNMEELLLRISRRNNDGKEGEIWISKLDLGYAYGQVMLSEKAKNLCIFTVTGGKFKVQYRFLKEFDGLADLATNFQDSLDKSFAKYTPGMVR